MTLKSVKCPVCKRVHVVAQGDLMSDLECTDNATSEIREMQDLVPNDILTRNAWNWNRLSIREDRYDNVPIIAPILTVKNSKQMGGGSSAKNY